MNSERNSRGRINIEVKAVLEASLQLEYTAQRHQDFGFNKRTKEERIKVIEIKDKQVTIMVEKTILEVAKEATMITDETTSRKETVLQKASTANLSITIRSCPLATMSC